MDQRDNTLENTAAPAKERQHNPVNYGEAMMSKATPKRGFKVTSQDQKSEYGQKKTKPKANSLCWKIVISLRYRNTMSLGIWRTSFILPKAGRIGFFWKGKGGLYRGPLPRGGHLWCLALSNLPDWKGSRQHAACRPCFLHKGFMSAYS